MLIFNRISIKSKVQVMLLLVSLGSILVAGYLSWSRVRMALSGRISEQLTSVRASKAYQIESYIKTLRHHVETLCEDRMVVAAMEEFNKGFNQLNQQAIAADWEKALATYYQQEFFPRLSKSIPGTPNYETYRPQSKAARYLQYQYIAKNPNPVGKKDLLVDALDKSQYNKYHVKYHAIFRNLIKKFGYYDFFLINYETGDIVYTVYKETDFGSNLDKGLYRQSNLAEVVAAVRKNPDKGSIQIIDFQPYRPSYMAPAAFIASPIYNGSQLVGILAIQMPVDEINNVLTGNKNWQRDGLGKTGETYMVGEDLLMRSVSRFLIEDPKRYKKTLESIGTKKSNIRLIEQLGTSILLQKVDTGAARAALAGNSGTKIVKNYQRQTVLSSYSPLQIEGLNWGIIAEMELSEADRPVYALQRDLFIATVIMALLIAYLANIVAHNLVKPIEVTIAGARQIGKEEPNFEEVLQNRDEVGELARIVNEIAQSYAKQTKLLSQKSRENEELLGNILPSIIVERLKKGEKQIADQIPQVTVAIASIFGLTALAANRNVAEVAELLTELIDAFDEAASRHEVEKFRTIGDRYIAVCGLSKPRLDREKRMVDFVLEAMDIVQSVNTRYNTRLSLYTGIHEGAVMAGILGTKKFSYDLWGETWAIANQLQTQAELNTIRVTEEVRERLQDVYDFQKDKNLKLDEINITTWVLRKGGLKDLISDLGLGLDLDDWNDSL